MEQHPIPRQITTFEFKLIGFMTLKQFLYLLVFVPTGYVVFRIFPIPIINMFLGICVGAVGAAFAFVPINDRPMDVWIKNLIKRLNSPTQYTFQKQNTPLYFLEDLYFVNDPHKVLTHIETREKLAEYLTKTQGKRGTNPQKNQIQSLLKTPTAQIKPIVHANEPSATVISKPPVQSVQDIVTLSQPGGKPIEPSPAPVAASPAPPAPQFHSAAHPFLTGVIKNHKQIPLPGILVYIKDASGIPLRLLKTNPHGIFATYNPLPQAEYFFEIKDPNGGYIFDTMKVRVPNADNKPYEFSSQAAA